MKELCLFDNRTFDYWNLAKETLIENGIDDLSMSQIEEEAIWIEQLDWNDTATRINELLIDAEGLLVSGSTQRWNGTSSGFDYVSWEGLHRYNNSLWEKFLADCCVDCSYFTIIVTNGVLYVEASHHNGTNYYGIRALTMQGVKAIEDWECGYRFGSLTNAHLREKIEKSRRYYWTPIKVA